MHNLFLSFVLEIFILFISAIFKRGLKVQNEITTANMSILKSGKAKAIRFSTLEAICKELDCQPGDILEYQK